MPLSPLSWLIFYYADAAVATYDGYLRHYAAIDAADMLFITPLLFRCRHFRLY